MNEPSVAFTLLALLLASTISLLVGFAIGGLLFGARLKKRRAATQAHNTIATVHRRDETESPEVDNKTDKRTIARLLKRRIVQDRLLKSTLQYNIKLKQAWRASNNSLDLANRKLALQHFATDRLRNKCEKSNREIDQLNDQTEPAKATSDKAPEQITSAADTSIRTRKPNAQGSTSSKVRSSTQQDAHATRVSADDDLTRIKGIGIKTQRALYRIGVRTFAQLAALDSHQIKAIDKQLSCQGRSKNYKWVEQARSLLKNDREQEIEEATAH